MINQIAKKGLKNEKMFLCEFVMVNLEKRCILKKKFDVSGILGSNDISKGVNKVNSWQKPRGLIGPVLIPGFCSASGRVENHLQDRTLVYRWLPSLAT